MSQNNQPLLANPIKMINFHGIILFIYSTGNKTYVPVRPIVDLIGNDWRTVRKTITTGDNQDLYGTITLSVPKTDNFGGLMLPENAINTPVHPDYLMENSPKSELIEVLCIRFDRVHLYLARVNTTRLRVNGNIDSADYLLKLQHEWADVLHNYETHGIAINKSKLEHTKYIKSLYDLYRVAEPHQQKCISKQIDDALGIQTPLSDDERQGDLLNQ